MIWEKVEEKCEKVWFMDLNQWQKRVGWHAFGIK